MKINVTYKKEKGKITINYTNEEREFLDRKFQSLALEQKETNYPLGVNVGSPVKYWRNTTNILVKSLGISGIIDDINLPIFQDGYFNIAIFRFIGKTVELPLKNILSSYEVEKLVDYLKEVYKRILMTPTEFEAEISFKFKSDVEKTDIKSSETKDNSIKTEDLIKELNEKGEIIVE